MFVMRIGGDLGMMGYIVIAEDETMVGIHVMIGVHQTIDAVFQVNVLTEMKQCFIEKEKLSTNVASIIATNTQLNICTRDNDADCNDSLCRCAK
jgi:hypothetical protein